MTKKIVFTSMVADLFHFGHLELLRRCSELGNFLVVGIINDQEVFRYKKRMPVIPFNQRLEIVRNIRFVDDVMPQNSRDGSENLRKLGNVDLLVRGDDVILDQEVSTIKELGGKFIQLKRTPNISTSSIIGKIKNKY